MGLGNWRFLVCRRDVSCGEGNGGEDGYEICLYGLCLSFFM